MPRGKIMCLIEFNSFDEAGVCTSAWKPSRPVSGASFFYEQIPARFGEIANTPVPLFNLYLFHKLLQTIFENILICFMKKYLEKSFAKSSELTGKVSFGELWFGVICIWYWPSAITVLQLMTPIIWFLKLSKSLLVFGRWLNIPLEKREYLKFKYQIVWKIIQPNIP